VPAPAAQVEGALHALEHIGVDDWLVLPEEQVVVVADLADVERGAEQAVHCVLVEGRPAGGAVLGNARPQREPARVEALRRERHRQRALVELEGELHDGGLLGHGLERAALAIDAVAEHQGAHRSISPGAWRRRFCRACAR